MDFLGRSSGRGMQCQLIEEVIKHLPVWEGGEGDDLKMVNWVLVQYMKQSVKLCVGTSALSSEKADGGNWCKLATWLIQ